MNSIGKQLKRLKDKIDSTPIEMLDALRDSIAISELHPAVKEACFEDIDYRQNMMVYANDAVAKLSDDIEVD